MEQVQGGVCAPEGFQAAGAYGGVRGTQTDKHDLALIVSETSCAAAAVYTTNKVKGAPLIVTKRHLEDGHARAIICNSGNANTCAPDGERIAEETCRLTAQALGLSSPDDVLVASTGVIGEKLTMAPFERGIPKLVAGLSPDGSAQAARGIMTTDTIPKEIAVRFTVDGTACTIGGIAKGSGMIHPNMATMLSFLTTDAAIAPALLQRVLSEDIQDTFNQVSVDGDTSTNDMVIVLANGLAGNPVIETEGETLDTFRAALHQVTAELAKKLAADGEGAGKLIQCRVQGAPAKQEARAIARSVVSSDLLKAAVFGEDANWGRVLCAIGYAPGEFSADHIDVVMRSKNGAVTVCRGSRYAEHSEEEAADILSADEIEIEIDMHSGGATAVAWGCDLTYDYVRINGDYRS